MDGRPGRPVSARSTALRSTSDLRPDRMSHADECPPTRTWGSATYAAARQPAGGRPDSAIVVLRPAPSVLSPGTAASELLAASAEFFGAQLPLDKPTDLGRCESRAELVARTRALRDWRGQPVALGFGAAGGVQYLGAALIPGRFDATAGSLFGAAITGWSRAGRLADPVIEPTADASAATSERSVRAWRRALDATGGIARSGPPASAPSGIVLRLPRSRSDEPAGPGNGLVPVLDAIGQVLGQASGGASRLVAVMGSNRQYSDLENFAGMAAQPGPIVLDDAVTSPELSSETRRGLLQRRLLGALRSARWCPSCLDAECGRFDCTLCDLFAETLVVNDTRQLALELEDLLDPVPYSRPSELADWPFHQGGSAFALATDTAGDLVFALRSSASALSGIEPADFLARISARLRSD
jgi:hypothetical protein